MLVAEPEPIYELLVTRSRDFAKDRSVRPRRFGPPPSRNTGGLIGNHDWRAHVQGRRILQPAFARETLEGHGETMVAEVERQIAGWEPGQTLDAGRAMDELAVATVVRTLFGGHAVPRERLARLARQVDAVTAAAPFVSTRGAAYTRLLHVRRLVRTAGAAQGLVETLGTLNRSAGSATVPGVLADELALTERDRLVEAFTVLLAGSETTAKVLTWALYLLARARRERALVRAELERALPDGHRVRPDDVEQLDYLRAVVREALRLYPASWFIGRRASADSELGGVPLERGTLVLALPYFVHRDPELYPDPERFAPERWLPAPELPRGAFVPFGAGPRQCIGERFALLELTLVLATILQRVELTPAHPDPVRVRAATSLEPANPVLLRVERAPIRGRVPQLAEERP